MALEELKGGKNQNASNTARMTMTVTTAALTMSIRHQSISGDGSWSRDGLDGAATVQRDGFTGSSAACLAFDSLIACLRSCQYSFDEREVLRSLQYCSSSCLDFASSLRCLAISS
jgi:hypothetical protein